MAKLILIARELPSNLAYKLTPNMPPESAKLIIPSPATLILGAPLPLPKGLRGSIVKTAATVRTRLSHWTRFVLSCNKVRMFLSRWPGNSNSSSNFQTLSNATFPTKTASSARSENGLLETSANSIQTPKKARAPT